MAVPKFLQSALWSYQVSYLDKNRDKGYIITQILNHGSWDQLRWLLKNYRSPMIKRSIQNPARGMWHDDALNYWTTIYNIRLPRIVYQRARFSLTPTNLPLPRQKKR